MGGAIVLDTIQPHLRVGSRVSATEDLAPDRGIALHEGFVGWVVDVVGGGCHLSSKEAEGKALKDI